MNSSKNGQILNKVKTPELYRLIGEITTLMMYSKVHSKFMILDIADIILPPIQLNQFRIYRDGNKKPVGFVSWAFFDDKTEKKYISGKAVMSLEEWNSGNNLFFTDFIAPFGHTKKMFKDLTHNIFPDSHAKTLRFTDQGKHRKNLIHLYGKNYRKKKLNEQVECEK
jgi:cytolysin-activating lysine-acyltransferase